MEWNGTEVAAYWGNDGLRVQFAIRARLINILSGLLLLAVGIYDFRANWALLQLYLH